MPITSTLRLLTLAAIALGGLAANAGAQAPKTVASKVAAQPSRTTKEKRMFTRPSDDEIRKQLTPKQFDVTQKEATESPFRNEYWDNHRDGIYVDIVSGEPLFSSLDKFESGTGWPSFTRPLEPANVTKKTDRAWGMERTEVRSAHADSHLGHLFDDGPKPTGMRYCINSASLRFIPVEKLEEEGYGEYLPLFKTADKGKATARP